MPITNGLSGKSKKTQSKGNNGFPSAGYYVIDPRITEAGCQSNAPLSCEWIPW